MNRFYYLLFIIALPTLAFSQSFKGKAFYKFNNSYADVDWSQKKLSASETAMWKSKMSEASRKSFQLAFTVEESTWSEVDMLSVNGKGGSSKSGWDEAKDNLLYKNLSSQSYTLETEAFDKLFLVNGNLDLPQWQLTGETKKIGTYNVQKATFTIEEEVMVFGKKELETQSNLVEAWFTTDIPISTGPSYYWGLPGLILEVKNGSISYICERIALNTEEDFDIEVPKKGEKVSSEELEEIIAKKTEEMYKKYNKTGKKG